MFKLGALAAAVVLAFGTAQAADPPKADALLKLSVMTPSVFTWWTLGPQTHYVRRDASVQGGVALRMNVEPSANTWDVQAGANAEKPIAKGDATLLAFWARAETPSPSAKTVKIIATIQQGGPPYEVMAKVERQIGSAWQLYCTAGTAPKDVKAGKWGANLQLATARQTVDIGPAFLLAGHSSAERKLLGSGCERLLPAVSKITVAPPSIAELKKKLEKILAETHTPAVSVAIVRRDGPEWIGAVGKADVQKNTPATADTLFRIGSISKTFVSTSILKLADEGKLSLNDPVHKLAPEIWFENKWEATDPVRVVDLLEHTTGWDDLPVRMYDKGKVYPTLRAQLDADHTSRISRWKPGTRWSYCNSGPAVAAYIVEKITGKPFEAYVAQNFFTPMGMKTATYFKPSANAVTLYHADGKRAYPYMEITVRPSGSINASAKDMSRLVAFYLHRGAVDGKQVLPSQDVFRMETSTRSWAARLGPDNDFGLGNYPSEPNHSGILFHGHNGGLEGDLSEMAYLRDNGVGYFFSINTGNGNAFAQVGNAIRQYVTIDVPPPAMPKPVPLTTAMKQYAGWYQWASPRNQLMAYQTQLATLTLVRVSSERLVTWGLASWNVRFVPVTPASLRREGSPLARTVLIAPNEDGRFIDLEGMLLKKIPAWVAYTDLAAVAWALLAAALIVLYLPVWLLAGLRKKWRKPQERWIKVWPLVALLSLAASSVISTMAMEDALDLLGNLTIWSGSIFVLNILFAVASLAGLVALWRAKGVRKRIYAYAFVVMPPLVIATVYLAWWGIIGLRTWA